MHKYCILNYKEVGLKSALIISYCAFWLQLPFIATLTMLLFIGFSKLSINKHFYLAISVLISFTLSLLAFTQQSTAEEGTDITRYYYEYQGIVDMPFKFLLVLLNEEILNYSFAFINVILVLLTGNVQFISLFWTFFIYYITFVSLWNLSDYLKMHVLEKGATLVFFMFFLTFGAILFTQITETIKSAAAISFFFYVLSLKINGLSWLKTTLLIFLCIGIHAQTIMLIPILFYNRFKASKLIVILAIIILISPFINVIDLIYSLFSSLGGWFGALFSRANSYGEDMASNSTIRYICIGLMLSIISIYLYKIKAFTRNSKILNINILYLCVMFLLYTVSDAFIRFANFSTFISSICMLGLMKNRRNRIYSFSFLIIMLILNLQMTLGRTIGGGYTSSYMDNSFLRIIGSSFFDYLSFKASI